MKRVNHHTEYIFLKAFVKSDWDDCSFAIIHVTDEWIQTTQKRIDAAIPFLEDSGFYHLSYWDKPEGFYRDSSGNSLMANEILSDDSDWCFVELNDNELDVLAIPENYLGSFQLIIYKDGCLCYKAYGEYSGEEFYTFDFRLSDITKKFKSHGTE